MYFEILSILKGTVSRYCACTKVVRSLLNTNVILSAHFRCNIIYYSQLT